MADPVTQLAVTAALTAGSMVLQATRKIEGPRLDDLSVTVADYGTTLNYFYAKRRFEGCPIIWAEPLKEVKKRSKTKGGKYNNYSYFATFAIAIADHEIEGVTRIWFDKHLVYDTTGAGPVTPFPLSFTSGQSKSGRPRTTSVNLEDHIRIYKGTATQEPDPRMEATVDAEFGAGSTPAYRNVSYIVFEELPVEKFGNRIPQISVEAVALVDPNYPYETKATDIVLGTFSFSPDGSRMLIVHGNDYEIWDTATRERMVSGTLEYDAQSSLAVSNTGSIYYITYDIGPPFNDSLVILNPDGIGTAGTVLLGMSASNCQCLEDANGSEYVLVSGSSVGVGYYLLPVGGTGANVDPGYNVNGGFTDAYGDIWIYGTEFDDSMAYLEKIVDVAGRGTPTSFSVSGTPGGAPGPVGAMHVPSHDQYFLRHQGSYFLIDDTTITQTDTGTWNGAATMDFLNPNPGSSVWTFGGGAAKKISTVDGSVLQTESYASWSVSTGVDVYEPVTNALVGLDNAGGLNWLYLDRIDGAVTTLGDICEDVCERAGVYSGSVDFSAFTQEIRGYSWTQGPGRDILEPLIDAYDCDVRPHDFSIQGVNRGATPSVTHNVSNFVRDGDNRYTVTIAQDTDLPRSVAFSFADTDADQQTNIALVARPLDAIDGARELAINMTTLVLDTDEAKPLAERWFRRRWFGREAYSLGLTMQALALEPGDVRILELDDITRKARLKAMTIESGGVIKTEWERDDPSINTLSSSSGADMDGRDPSVILISSLTKSAILDMPLAIDAHNSTNPFVYFAAGKYPGTMWAGADYYVSDTGLYDDYEPGWAAIASTDSMDWGYATEALGDALPWVIDYGNTLNVSMKSGTLTSSTESAVLEDGTLNLAVVGNEYIQFITATLEGDGTYTLSGLLRGRRGTEAEISEHNAGDRFIVFDSKVFRHEMGADEIGDTDYYRAVSQGRELDSATTEAVEYTAAPLRPLSPVHGFYVLDTGTGDYYIHATRRTRIGGASVDGQDVPLGETSESYSFDVLDGADVIRTITGTSLPLLYDFASQTADWSGAWPAPLGDLYQVSPALSLRGYPLAIAA